MTEKEALQIIRQFSGNDAFQDEALTMAEDALGKQISEKPTDIQIACEWKDEKDEYIEYCGNCPECEYTVNSNANYCYNCGQKLDWEDSYD